MLMFGTSFWLEMKLSGAKELWDLLSMLKNPPRTFIAFLVISGTVYSGAGYELSEILISSLAVALLGGAIGTLFNAYWDIA